MNTHEDRAFVERSLADLEREHAAGDLSDDDLARLSRRYQRRLKVLDGSAVPVARRRARPGRRLARVAGVFAVAVGAGVFVSRSAGQRLPGQTLSKSEASGTAQLLSEARGALGTDRKVAATLYDKVLAVEPDNVEARTYRAWIERLDTKAQVDAGTLTAEAAKPRLVSVAERLDATAKLDSTFADPRCFQTVITFRDLALAEQSRVLYEQCVGTNPSQQALALVSKVGEDIDIALAALPNPVVSKLAKARIAYNGTPVTALALYDEVIAIDPRNVEARTWKEWLTASSAIQIFTRGKLAEDVLLKTLDGVQTRLSVVRADAPNDGNPACADAALRIYRGDTSGATAPLAICRTSVADPTLRGYANDLTAAAAAVASEASAPTATKAP